MPFFRRRRRGGPIAMMFAIVFGVYLIYSGWQISTEAKASLRWPSVIGRVLSSEVRREEHTSSRRKSVSYSYVADVRFEYTVDGQPYQADTVYIGQAAFSTPEAAEKLVKKYPAEKMVMISYNPKRPGRAVLEDGPNPGSNSTFFYIGGVFGILIGIFGLRSSLASLGRERNDNI